MSLHSVQRLCDYKPTTYTIRKVELTIDLDENSTKVHSSLWIETRSSCLLETLVLDGVGLELVEIRIDSVPFREYTQTEKTLEFLPPARSFLLETVCLVQPNRNLALEGLYQSGKILCTQCEAQGFRHITYFLDRPDLMTLWKVTLRADHAKYPLLLSNGNKIFEQRLPENRHEVVWQDPWPKPSYLFALAAGDLFCIEESYRGSLSQKVFALKIYCEPHNAHRLSFAMESLKKAMRWDEIHYGREYDLEAFHIVAVDSFNMGAMENKGLNIFNTSCLLADFDSTTDEEFRRIEAIVAHEYFHNWTGNRITCRDWFQLTLKEGLTVFRDHQFSAEEHGADLVRLEQVQSLVQRQFVEDAGALAHPIQPLSYEDINNFYTTTVYEKGSEVIRMLHTLFGAHGYRKALDHYFAKQDGQAVTREEFIRSFEEALSVDLTNFRAWYTHYRTPQVELKRHFNGSQLFLTLTQQPTLCVEGEARALPIPLQTAFFDPSTGRKTEERMLLLENWEQTFVVQTEKKLLVSLNRALSAPVEVRTDQSLDEEILLAKFEDDPVCKWMQMRAQLRLCSTRADFSPWILLVKGILEEKNISFHTKADLIEAPSEAQWLELVAGHSIEEACFFYRAVLEQTSHALRPLFQQLIETLPKNIANHSPEASGARRLRAVCYSYSIESEPESFAALWKEMQEANGMSERYYAFRLLVKRDNPYREKAIALYRKLHFGDNLTWPKWLSAQASSLAEDTLKRCQAIASDPLVYKKTVPNQVRALLGAFSANPSLFHAADGSGYRWILDQIVEIDAFNPQTASKIAKAFSVAPLLQPAPQKRMIEVVELGIRKEISLSLREILSQIVEKTL